MYSRWGRETQRQRHLNSKTEKLLPTGVFIRISLFCLCLCFLCFSVFLCVSLYFSRFLGVSEGARSSRINSHMLDMTHMGHDSYGT